MEFAWWRHKQSKFIGKKASTTATDCVLLNLTLQEFKNFAVDTVSDIVFLVAKTDLFKILFFLKIWNWLRFLLLFPVQKICWFTIEKWWPNKLCKKFTHLISRIFEIQAVCLFIYFLCFLLIGFFYLYVHHIFKNFSIHS